MVLVGAKHTYLSDNVQIRPVSIDTKIVSNKLQDLIIYRKKDLFLLSAVFVVVFR